METFQGYRRPQGLPGVRNSVAVIPSVFCANTVARRIAEHVAGAVAFCHPVGCSQVGLDLELTARGLKGLGKHPNFYGVVVVGLGCERLRPRELAGEHRCRGQARRDVGDPGGGRHPPVDREGDYLRQPARRESLTAETGGVSPLRTLPRTEVRRDGRHFGACGQSRPRLGHRPGGCCRRAGDLHRGDRTDRGGTDPRRPGQDPAGGRRDPDDDRQHGKEALCCHSEPRCSGTAPP